MPEIVYKNECKIIYGLLFKIQNDLGTNFQEKHYQRAFEGHLNENKIPYEKEFPLEVNYHGNILGKFFVDFTVWNKIIIEFKTTNIITSDHLKQVLRYLQASDMKLGLIVNFRQRPLKPVRVLNSKVSHSRDSQAKPLA